MQAPQSPDNLIAAQRLAAGPYYPARESDGEWVLGPLTDLRAARIVEAREGAQRCITEARAQRTDGRRWAVSMQRAAELRERFGKLKKSGGRVQWNDKPCEVVS